MQTYSFLVPKTVTTLNVESQLENAIPTKLDISFLQLSCDCSFVLFSLICQLSISILKLQSLNSLQISKYVYLPICHKDYENTNFSRFQRRWMQSRLYL